jgi:hypothetical protein
MYPGGGIFLCYELPPCKAKTGVPDMNHEMAESFCGDSLVLVVSCSRVACKDAEMLPIDFGSSPVSFPCLRLCWRISFDAEQPGSSADTIIKIPKICLPLKE